MKNKFQHVNINIYIERGTEIGNFKKNKNGVICGDSDRRVLHYIAEF